MAYLHVQAQILNANPGQPDGIWVAEGSRFSNTIKPVTDPEFGIDYLHYLFYPERICFGFNPYETAGCYSGVTYDGDTIRVNGIAAFHLARKGPDRIQLTRLPVGTAITKLVRMQEFRVVGSMGGAMPATSMSHPVHIGPFINLFFFNSLVIYPAPRADQSIRVAFTVTADGMVQDVEVLSKHSRLRRRWFVNTLLGTQMQWIPALVNGKPVHSRVTLEVIRTGYTTITAEEKGMRFYSKAAQLITRKDYAGALLYLNDALVHSPRNPRYLYNQAVCYFYLKDERKQCQKLLQAREICPFIPTAMADEQLGILVECYKPSTSGK